MKAVPTIARLVPLLGLSFALSTHADVIYSGLQDIAIPQSQDGVYLNVITGSQSSAAGWHINPIWGGTLFFNSDSFQPVREGTIGSDNLRNLSQHSIVSSGSSFFDANQAYGVSFDHMGNTFTAGTESYLGFSVVNGASTNYGWMRVVFTGTGTPLIKDWAYNTGGGSVGVGNVIQSGSTFTLDSTAQDFTLDSTIGGPNSVVINGGNTVTLTGSHGYTGATTINSGTLAISGSGSINNSAVTLNGGTFRFNSSVAYVGSMTFTSGTIGGTNLTGILGGLEIDAGQTLSPGSEIGSGTADTTSQTWSGGGTYQFEISNVTGMAGNASGWDLLAGNGSLTINATSGSRFNIDIEALGLNPIDVNFDEAGSHQWLIADFTSISGFSADAFTIDTSNFFATDAGAFAVALGGSAGIGGDDTQIFLTYAAPIPEPRAALLGALGMLALLRRRR